MVYLSPYQLLELDTTPPEDLDATVLRRVQRKLMADFDLSQEAVVVRAGIELDKSTALKLIEELKDPERAALHWRVHQDKGLSSFLRDPLHTHPEVIPEIEIGQFRSFVSPYLGDAINQFLRKALRLKEYSIACEAVEKISYLVFRDQEAAFQSTRTWMDQRFKDLESWTAAIEKVNYQSEEVLTALNKRLIFFLNFLPDRYQNWRNRYAVALLNFSLPTINERKLGRQAFLAIEAASQLKLDEAQTRRVKHVYQQLEKYRNSPDPTSKLKSGKKTPFLQGCLILWMILITIMVTAAFFTGIFRPSQNKPVRDQFYVAGLKENGLLWNRRRLLFDKIASYISTASDGSTPSTEDSSTTDHSGPVNSTLGSSPSENPDIPRRPYEAFLSESLLTPPFTNDFDSLIVDNQSGYDVVIFISNPEEKKQFNHYFLARGGLSDDYPYPPGTIYQCYLGNNWNGHSIPFTITQDRDTTWFGAFTQVRHFPRHDPGLDNPRFVVTLPEVEAPLDEQLIRRITITRDSMVVRREKIPSP